jgi:hypothetical protein
MSTLQGLGPRTFHGLPLASPPRLSDGAPGSGAAPRSRPGAATLVECRAAGHVIKERADRVYCRTCKVSSGVLVTSVPGPVNRCRSRGHVIGTARDGRVFCKTCDALRKGRLPRGNPSIEWCQQRGHVLRRDKKGTLLCRTCLDKATQRGKQVAKALQVAEQRAERRSAAQDANRVRRIG